jgi:hypothetical protein
MTITEVDLISLTYFKKKLYYIHRNISHNGISESPSLIHWPNLQKF